MVAKEHNKKKMIYNSMVKSVLMYGAETWSLYEDDRRRINANEMDALTLRLLMSYIYIYIYIYIRSTYS